MEEQPDKEAERLRRAEEYQMQLFGLHSRSVTAAISRKITDNINSSCTKMGRSIEKNLNMGAEASALLKKDIKLLSKTYQHNAQPHLRAIQNIVNKFINVPNNILLSEDQCQRTQYSDAEMSALEKKLDDLQQRLKKATMFNVTLREELEVAESIKESEVLAIKLCDIAEKSLSANKFGSKTLRAIEKVKGLSESLDTLAPQTQENIYNPRLSENELEEFVLNNDSSADMELK